MQIERKGAYVKECVCACGSWFRIIMFFVVRSNDSFNFSLGLIKYIVVIVIAERLISTWALNTPQWQVWSFFRRLRPSCMRLGIYISDCRFTQSVLNLHPSGYSAVWLFPGCRPVSFSPIFLFLFAGYEVRGNAVSVVKTEFYFSDKLLRPSFISLCQIVKQIGFFLSLSLPPLTFSNWCVWEK